MNINLLPLLLLIARSCCEHTTEPCFLVNNKLGVLKLDRNIIDPDIFRIHVHRTSDGVDFETFEVFPTNKRTPYIQYLIATSEITVQMTKKTLSHLTVKYNHNTTVLYVFFVFHEYNGFNVKIAYTHKEKSIYIQSTYLIAAIPTNEAYNKILTYTCYDDDNPQALPYIKRVLDIDEQETGYKHEGEFRLKTNNFTRISCGPIFSRTVHNPTEFEIPKGERIYSTCHIEHGEPFCTPSSIDKLIFTKQMELNGVTIGFMFLLFCTLLLLCTFLWFCKFRIKY
ncbi:hypothetical protein SNEBB_000179 [Seison nebaliae]|nr:hypothetical protein SNEBB_000179 [Seison nebaliae]